MPSAGKNKGTGRYHRQGGMGRLRNANLKEVGRVSGWASRAEDDEYLERHGHSDSGSHAGERLVSRFNRLVALGTAGAHPGEPAEVCEVRPGMVVVRFPDGREAPAALRRALEKRIVGMSNTIAVGDRVRVETEAGDLAIAAIEPRINQLARRDSHNHALEHVLAANLDRLVVVAALHEPDFKHGFVDRALLMATTCGIAVAVAVTKRDLGDTDAILALYRGLGLACVAVDARDDADPGVVELRELLRGRICAFAGQSGVGKSTLVNACFPGAGAKVGSVADAGFGRHTTTAARSFLLPGGGRMIDTPGIREVVITGFSPTDVALHFPDLARLLPKCRFQDCSHRHEPDCAVKAALEAGELAPSRYFSYLSIVEDDLAI